MSKVKRIIFDKPLPIPGMKLQNISPASGWDFEITHDGRALKFWDKRGVCFEAFANFVIEYEPDIAKAREHHDGLVKAAAAQSEAIMRARYGLGSDDPLPGEEAAPKAVATKPETPKAKSVAKGKK